MSTSTRSSDRDARFIEVVRRDQGHFGVKAAKHWSIDVPEDPRISALSELWWRWYLQFRYMGVTHQNAMRFIKTQPRMDRYVENVKLSAVTADYMEGNDFTPYYHVGR